jgi:hypothetical protein
MRASDNDKQIEVSYHRLSLSDARMRLAPGKAGRRPATRFLHVLYVSM